ncbi:CHASE2 domain-containing protein [Legionella yabuuchiae]|uniref:CHASE2 domain-containing protein n=1 Tax=Legionella yabuuchiae TaxID=376727 RepID=UPI0013EF7A57|nr:CHASE2 domain-containing protein [Legionella yabuuchiae]
MIKKWPVFEFNLPPALLLSIVVAILVWVVSFLNVYKLIDGYAYDSILVSTPSYQTSVESKVLLIQANQDIHAINEPTWIRFLDNLEQSNPSQVIFLFFPSQAGVSFYSKAKQYGNVLFGRRMLSDTKAQVLEPWPEHAKDLNLPFGVQALPKSQYGVYRFQHTDYSFNNQPMPAVEIRVAQQLDHWTKPPKAKTYYIDFLSGTASLPFLTLSRAFEDELVSEMIKNRAIIIGNTSPDSNNLTTPLIHNGLTISEPQFHAYALQTLLSKEAIQWMGPFIKLLFLILVSIGSLLMLNATSRQTTTVLLLFSLFVMDFLLAWAILVWFKLWIPLLAIWLTHLALYVVLTRYRLMEEEKKALEVLFELSSKIQDKALDIKVYASDQYWSNIIVMLNQTLNLSCAIFLECIPNSHRLKEVSAMNCSLNNINERRRDYHRDPYKTAIETHNLMQVENFIDCGKTKSQFLYALIHSNETLGFWVFCLDKEQKLSHDQKIYINQLGNQIAFFLHLRKLWLKEEQQKENIVLRFLNLERHFSVAEKMQSLVAKLERRLTITKDFLSAQTTGCIYFDLFGRQLLANEQAEQIFKRAEILTEELSALDLLVSITNMNLDNAREVLQELIVIGTEIVFDIQLPNHYEQQFQLRLSVPNVGVESYKTEAQGMLSLERRGLFFEFVKKD